MVAEALLLLALSPYSCLEPCTIKASITIVGYEETRSVCLRLRDVELDTGTESTRQSCWPWSGRKVTDVTLRAIPAGEYEVIVTLEGGLRAMQRLRVGGHGDALLRGFMVSLLGGDIPTARVKAAIRMLNPSVEQLDAVLRTFPQHIHRSALRSLLRGVLPSKLDAPSLQEQGIRPPSQARYRHLKHSRRAQP